MNPLPSEIYIGVLGELLVQQRLLIFEVQAAKPLADTGNDLVAFKGRQCRTIQVKTTKKDEPYPEKSGRDYDLAAFVLLKTHNGIFSADRSEIFLVPHADVATFHHASTNREPFRLTFEHVSAIFR